MVRIIIIILIIMNHHRHQLHFPFYITLTAPAAILLAVDCATQKRRTLASVRSNGILPGTRNRTAMAFVYVHSPCNGRHAVSLVREWIGCWTLPAEGERGKNEFLNIFFWQFHKRFPKQNFRLSACGVLGEGCV